MSRTSLAINKRYAPPRMLDMSLRIVKNVEDVVPRVVHLDRLILDCALRLESSVQRASVRPGVYMGASFRNSRN